MKKTLLKTVSFLIILSLCIVFLPACSDHYREYTYGDFRYVVEDGEVIITEYTGNERDPIIPASIDDMPVVTIYSGAFLHCDSIKSVVIPDSVVRIDGLAFNQCGNLERITLGSGVQEIDFSPFAHCDKIAYNEYENGYYLGNDQNPYLALVHAKHSGIESLTIHPDTRIICGNAMEGCTSLSELTIPQSVTYIGSYAMERTALQSIYIPETVVSMGSYVFKQCYSLSEIVVADQNPSYKSIDGNLFSRDGRDLLQYAIGHERSSYRIPEGTVEIHAEAFAYATNLTEVLFSDSVEVIGHMAFINCESLQSIDFGNSLKAIDGQAFGFCKSLTEVTIPDSVQEISYSVFSNCDKLERAVIGSGVVNLGDSVFRSCDALNEVVFRDPSGWQVKTMYALWGQKINLSDPQKNADYLTGEYCDYYWNKK